MGKILEDLRDQVLNGGYRMPLGLPDGKTIGSDSRSTRYYVDRLSFLGDLKGLSVLEIGCSIGYDSMLMTSGGAKVTALDTDPKAIALAKIAAEMQDVNIDFHCVDYKDFLEQYSGPVFDIIYISLVQTDLDLVSKHTNTIYEVLTNFETDKNKGPMPAMPFSVDFYSRYTVPVNWTTEVDHTWNFGQGKVEIYMHYRRNDDAKK